MRWWERESRLTASRRRAWGRSVRSAPSLMRLAGNKTGAGISCTRSKTRWLQTLGSNAGAAMSRPFFEISGMILCLIRLEVAAICVGREKYESDSCDPYSHFLNRCCAGESIRYRGSSGLRPVQRSIRCEDGQTPTPDDATGRRKGPRLFHRRRCKVLVQTQPNDKGGRGRRVGGGNAW